MKTLLFIGLIASSVVYLAVNESSAVLQWLQQQSPESQMEKITSSLNESLNSKVEQQVAAFREQVQAEHQAQIAGLQGQVADMEQQMAVLQAQKVTVQPHTTQPQLIAAVQSDVVEIGAVDRNSFDSEIAQPDEAAEPLMTNLQRRKALQNLSQRMALKALSMGR